MTRTRFGLVVAAAVMLAFAGSPVQVQTDAIDLADSAVRTAAEDFDTVSDGPQIGDLSSVRVQNGTEPTVSAPTFTLTGPAPAPPTTSQSGSTTTTTKVGTGQSGKESTSISGSGSFSSSQGSGSTSGSSSGSRSQGSGSDGSGGGGDQPDPNQICNMPAMC